MAKYDGVTFQEARGQIRRFKVARLPPYVLLHYRRFTRNNFVEERNPTIVNFPVKGLDLSDYAERSGDDDGEADADADGSTPLSEVYDLVSNVTHECTAGTVRDDSVWRAQVHTSLDGEPLRRGGNANANANADPTADPTAEAQEEHWFQMQDLIVEDVNKQMIFLGETYFQVWKRRKLTARQVEVLRRVGGGGGGSIEGKASQSRPRRPAVATAATPHASKGTAAKSRTVGEGTVDAKGQSVSR